jgi:pantetheine-phosphate adenylyltransferase
MKWIQEIYKDNPKIEVKKYTGLTVEFCKKENAHFLLGGLRNSHDFEFEKDMAQMNKDLNPNIETIFIITSPEISHISSSTIRDIIKNKGDVSKFIPKEVNLKRV